MLKAHQEDLNARLHAQLRSAAIRLIKKSEPRDSGEADSGTEPCSRSCSGSEARSGAAVRGKEAYSATSPSTGGALASPSRPRLAPRSRSRLNEATPPAPKPEGTPAAASGEGANSPGIALASLEGELVTASKAAGSLRSRLRAARCVEIIRQLHSNYEDKHSAHAARLQSRSN